MKEYLHWIVDRSTKWNMPMELIRETVQCFFLRRNRKTILYLGKGNKMVYAWTPFTFFINTDLNRGQQNWEQAFKEKKKKNQ